MHCYLDELMNWPEVVNIAAPVVATIIGSLLAALSGVLWFLLVRLINRVGDLGDGMAKMAAEQAERFATVDNFIRTELRTLDVRLSVVETMLTIKKP